MKTAKIPEVLALYARAGIRRFKCATAREADVLAGLDELRAPALASRLETLRVRKRESAARELEKEGDHEDRESGSVGSHIIRSALDTIGGYGLVIVLLFVLFASLGYSVGVTSWTTIFSEQELDNLMAAQGGSCARPVP